MYCINCGKQNPEGANFCYHCGTAMEKAVPSPVDSDVLPDEPVEEAVISEPPVYQENNISNPPKKGGKKSIAITGLIFSIVGLAVSVLCCVYFGSMILGVACSAAGIVLCAMSMKSTDAATIAVTGLIVGIIGVIIGIMMLIFLLALFTTDAMSASFFEEFIEEFLY